MAASYLNYGWIYVRYLSAVMQGVLRVLISLQVEIYGASKHRPWFKRFYFAFPSNIVLHVNTKLLDPLLITHFISCESSTNKLHFPEGKLQETETIIDLLLLPPTSHSKHICFGHFVVVFLPYVTIQSPPFSVNSWNKNFGKIWS